MQYIMNHLSRVSPSFEDSLWLVDSTPVECGRSRETTRRSELAGWAEYGWRASHSRYFWGVRLHLVATAAGLPILWALAPAKADERDIALEMLASSGLTRAGQTIMADKGLKTHLDLERHGGRTKAGVLARVLQRLLALTAAIWHNQTTNQPGPARSLIAWTITSHPLELTI